ncbi:MAG: helix-turn-helix domain-containing protein [Cellvibrionaceae bacterium]|nr:helix-turn-helix domain-containing protein [Cellvibrionaceae bacterium]
MNVVGPQIKQCREKLGLTQEELTARCNLLGWDISRSTLAKVESQVRRVTDDEVLLFAKALEVSLKALYP